MKKYLVIKDNYVVNIIIWDEVSEFQYPDDSVTMMEDLDGNISIGMYFEQSEGIFYYPNKIPPDAPDEIKYIWE